MSFRGLWNLLALTLAPIPLQVKRYWELILKWCSSCLLWLHSVLYFLYFLIYFDIPLNIWIIVYEFFSYCNVNILRIRSKSFEAVRWIILIIFILSNIIILYSIRNDLIRIISCKRLSPGLSYFVLEKQLVNHLVLSCRVPFFSPATVSFSVVSRLLNIVCLDKLLFQLSHLTVEPHFAYDNKPSNAFLKEKEWT